MSKIVPVPTRRWHGNEAYPLPSSYAEIEVSDPEMARLLRVNACKQWDLDRKQIIGVLAEVVEGWEGLGYQEKEYWVKEYKADAYVASIIFFDHYYLHPDPEGDFDPGFYDETPLPAPDYHYLIWRGFAVHPLTLDVAPRGGAKSMCVRKPIMLTMLTKNTYKVLYCTSSQKNATDTAQMVRKQLYGNPRIVADFGPEMPEGKTKPSRGEAPTGIEWFQLANGSQLVTYSVNSKMRGGRPHWFVLDDPEYDFHASTSPEERRAYMYRLIFTVAMGMIMRAGARMSWLATFVSKRHFAWMAMETHKVEVDGVVKEVARIPEFEPWQRRLIRACWTDEKTGKLVSCWPHRWPADEEEKIRLNLDPGTPTLADVQQRMAGGWRAEFLGDPGGAEESYFPLEEKKHGWWLVGTDEAFWKNPRQSSAVIKWMSGDVERSMKVSEFLKNVRLFITMDTSKTATKDSDWKVAHLMAVNDEHFLFSLDLWAGQCHPETLQEAAFAMAKKWGCKWIVPEAIDDGIVLERSMRNEVQRRAKQGEPAGSLPVVKGFNPGFTRKVSKIAALMGRFQHGMVKLPFFMQHREPWLSLFGQIVDFNPASDDGGLKNDDHLDTLSMSEYVVVARVPRGDEQAKEETDVLKLLAAGKTTDEMGNSLLMYLDISTLTEEQWHIISKAAMRPDRKVESLA